MHPFVQALQAHYAPHRNSEKAEPMSRYMKNHFPFLGIQTPERKQLLRSFLAEHGKPSKEDLPEIVRGLWNLPEREYAIVALDILEKNIKLMDESFV